MGEEPAIRRLNERASTFLPKPRPSLSRAVEYLSAGSGDELRREVFRLEAIFRGEERTTALRQAAWMGRGCFLRGARHDLVTKGVGPGPGSEAMRRMMDAPLRHRPGGCLRLETDTYYPLLVRFQEAGGRWTLSNPRPEGFSSFANLVREAEAGTVLERLGIPVVSPLLLLRHRVAAPWSGPTRDGLQRYLLERSPAAISRHLNAGDTTKPVFPHVNAISYCDLDGGILIRAAATAYRVVNLHVAAIDDDRDLLAALTHHMMHLHCHQPDSTGALWRTCLDWMSSLGRTAAALFHQGLLHGQLNLHYQNVTLAGELADFDTTVFIRAAGDWVTEVPFTASAPKGLYQRYWNRIGRFGDHWQLDLMARINTDFRQLAGVRRGSLDVSRLAGAMLRQIYDLFNHGLRAVDLLHRYRARDLQRPGTVLTRRQCAEIQGYYGRAFSNALTRSRSVPLLIWSLEHGRDELFGRLLDLRNRYTLYGWTNPGVPLDHYGVLCDDSRHAHILREARSLLEAILPTGR